MSQLVWKTIERYPDYEINEAGKVRSVSTKKYKKSVNDLLGRELVVLYEDNGYARCWYIEDLLAVTFGPHEGQTAIVKSDELVKLMPESRVSESSNKKDKRKKSIRCIETGQVFKSYTECAKYFKFNYDKFYYQVKYNHNPYGGYTFEEVE